MAITELEIFNVKKLKYVHIRPLPGVNVIGGNNAEGKTSLLDAIAYGLGGKKLCPAKPIRDGETSAIIKLSLEAVPERMMPAVDVIRRFDKLPNGDIESTLTIEDRTDPERAQAPSPQTLLNDALGRTRIGDMPIGFDPLAFSRMPAKDQVATLLSLVELDFTDLEKQKAAIVAERLEVGRDGKKSAAVLSQCKEYPEAMAAIDVSEIKAEHARRVSINQENDKLRQAAEAAKSTLLLCTRNVESHEMAIDDIEKQIAGLKEKLAARYTAHQKTQDTVAEAEKAAAVAAAAVKTDEALADVMEQMEAAQENNRRVAANEARATLARDCELLRVKYQALTDSITSIDAQKAKAIAGANWPLPGIGFDDSGVCFEGRPLKQASSAEQLQISVAVGCAKNPALKIMLIREGSLLDDEQMQVLAAIADKYKAQCFVERVGLAGKSHVVMHDGNAVTVAPEVKA